MPITILFLDPNNKLPNERKSKLLDPNCSLYQLLTNYRNKLLQIYGSAIDNNRIDFHIELIKNNEEYLVDKLLARTKILQNKTVNLSWKITQKAIMIDTGYVDGYGETHSTVAFFPKGVPNEINLEFMNKF